MDVKKKNPAAVALGRKGGKKGGLARAVKLTPEQRSESARKAVQARWAKRAKTGNDYTMDRKKPSELGKAETSEAASAAAVLDTSKKALHLCLKHIKEAKNESELRRLTEKLQRIVFHRQYQNA
jgi:thiamine pyrophosphate-dependent acetolactate synthase large subunit-like protein